MRAIYFEEFNGPISFVDLPIPTPSPNTVVIKVLATGLCRSDWHGYVGHDTDIKLPHVPGHELAGTVHEVGTNVKNFKIGDRVTVPFVNGCGKCEFCLSNNAQVCPNQTQPGFTQFGSFAEYVSIENADFNLIAMPDEIDFNTAAALGCRFATSFRGLTARANVKSSDTVAVFGCGGVGLSALIIAKALGSTTIAIDVNENALAKAKEFKADYLIDSSKVDAVAEILKITNGVGATVSVDALGSEQTANQSVLSLKRRGKHIQLGLLLTPTSTTPMPMARVIAFELDLIGSHGMAPYEYKDLLAFIVEKKLDLTQLIASVEPLENGPELLKNLPDSRFGGVIVLNPHQKK